MRKLPRLLRPPRGRKAWARALILLILIGATGDYWLFPVFAHEVGQTPVRRSNGLWLGYDWYLGKHKSYEVGALAQRLQDAAIAYAFFHVRGVQSNGKLKFRYPVQARELTEALDHRLRKIAWVYVGSDVVDLSDSKVRSNMVAEARWLVTDCGFDGVQWDYETCRDGNAPFLHLLSESRVAMPEGSFLGTAVPCRYPFPFAGFGWGDSYYQEVAKRCDQMAVMAYDTGAYFPRLYVSMVASQVEGVTRAVAGTRCSVLIGLPTYEGGLRSHNPRAENLRLGLLGVRDGLSRLPKDAKSIQGIALFADYTTDEEEWETYRKLWIGDYVE